MVSRVYVENGGLNDLTHKVLKFSFSQVSSIMANGPAATSGFVDEGDLLISVNGVSIDGMTDR